jgi:hypothetical protein
LPVGDATAQHWQRDCNAGNQFWALYVQAMARASNAEWTNWIETARARDIHDIAVQFGCQLKREGHEWVGPCPVCGGRDRFAVNQHKRVFNCRGSEDGKGDGIALVMHVEGCDFIGAVERINGTPRPDRSRDENAEDRKRREQAYAARAQEYARREAEERAAMEAKAAHDAATIAEVLRRAVPLEGTLGERYLRENRGLMPPKRLIGDLRFVENLDYWGYGDNGSNEPVLLASVPALIAIIRDSTGEIIGISQTFLDPKEPKKWQPSGSPRNNPKKVRGKKQGGMIRLGSPEETIAIAEGWENALAWFQMGAPGAGSDDLMLAAAVDIGNLSGHATGMLQHPWLRDETGRPTRVSNGLPDMGHPGIILPEGITSVISICDGDSEPVATAMQMLTAARRFRQQGRHVTLWWPNKPGIDANDMLRAEALGQ